MRLHSSPARTAALLLPLCLAAAACAAEPQAKAAPTPATGSGTSTVVAEGPGFRVTLADVDKEIVGPLAELRDKEYELRRMALDKLTLDKLIDAEAKARGVTREALLAAEVEAKVPAPAAAEVDALYEQNKNNPRLGNQPKAAVLPQIERFLRQRGAQERMEAYRGELFRKHGVKIALDPPRTAIPLPAAAPSLGPADARVTIIQFTDYQCPFCKRAQQTVDEVMTKYAGKVRLVSLDYPLDFHTRAPFASKASHCAGEQGKFWELHRALLLEANDLSDAEIRGLALKQGVDGAKFDACYSSERYEEQIRKSLAEAAYYGVSSTPTFFINGRKIAGALPFSAFAQIIDEELAR